MNSSPMRLTPVRTAVALIIAIVAVLAVVTVGFSGAPKPPTAAPAPAPTVSPTTAPTPHPTSRPSTAPRAAPSAPVDHPPIEGDVTIDLAEASGHDVKATVRDDSGAVIGVHTGTPADGMSVAWHDIAVKNLDERTVQITWIGMGLDETVFVGISADGDGYVVDIVQKGLMPNSHTLGHDRALVLTFGRPVPAADVTGGVADSTAP